MRNIRKISSNKEMEELSDIGLLDHIIIGSNGAYYSFMENTNIGGVSDGT